MAKRGRRPITKNAPTEASVHVRTLPDEYDSLYELAKFLNISMSTFLRGLHLKFLFEQAMQAGKLVDAMWNRLSPIDQLVVALKALARGPDNVPSSKARPSPDEEFRKRLSEQLGIPVGEWVPDSEDEKILRELIPAALRDGIATASGWIQDSGEWILVPKPSNEGPKSTH
jgi:hypothetical protein